MVTKRIIIGIEFNSRSSNKPKWRIGLTPGWIRYRMSVFMKYTMQSLKKQTNQDFVALVQYADRTKAIIKRELKKYGPLPDNVKFISRSRYQKKIKKLIKGFDYLYLVRLDCDDMYHKSMVQQLKKCRHHSKTQALINQKGYIYDAVRKRIAPVHFKSPPFYTLVYKVRAYMKGKRYRLARGRKRGHNFAIRLKHKILTRKGKKNYMIVIHKRNTLNQQLLRRRSFQRKASRLKKILRNFYK